MSTGCRNALPGPWTASSVAPVSCGYERALRPCHEPAIAPRQRVSHSETSSEPIRVLIADDHAVVREGLRTFLGLQDGLEVVGEAEDGEQALREAERVEPDVVLMDLVMPKLDGVAAMQELRRRVPGARVVILTSYLDDERLLPALRAGAAGYLLKNVQPQELARAIRIADAGETLIDPAVAARLGDALREEAEGAPELAELTPREREVLALIGRGYANKRIALELSVAEKTVKTHVSHVLAKLGVADRTQAALYAARHLGLKS